MARDNNNTAYVSFDELSIDDPEDHVGPDDVQYLEQVEEEVEEQVGPKRVVRQLGGVWLERCGVEYTGKVQKTGDSMTQALVLENWA